MNDSASFGSALALVYVLAGFACAAWVVAVGRRTGVALAADALLLVCLWPLYAPFALGVTEPGGQSRERTLMRALKRAEGTAMAKLLPDRKTARWLCRDLRLAAQRVKDIDQLLSRPEMREEAALAQLERVGLQAQGGMRTAGLMRLQNIRQLAVTRSRLSRHLEQVDVVLEQALAQAETVRLLGRISQDVHSVAPAAEVMRDLLAQVEAVGQMLDDEEPGVVPAASIGKQV